MFYSINIPRNVSKLHFQKKKEETVHLPSRGQCWSVKWLSFSSLFGNSWDKERKRKGRNTLEGRKGEKEERVRDVSESTVQTTDAEKTNSFSWSISHSDEREKARGSRKAKHFEHLHAYCVSVSGTQRAGATAKLSDSSEPFAQIPRIRQKALQRSSSSLSGDLFVLISPGMRDPQISVRVGGGGPVVFLAHDSNLTSLVYAE